VDTVVRRAGPLNRPTRLIQAADGTLFCSDWYANAAFHILRRPANSSSPGERPGATPASFALCTASGKTGVTVIWWQTVKNSRAQAFSADGECSLW
jgi:hypothetical protein